MRGADAVIKIDILPSSETSPHAWSRWTADKPFMSAVRNISTCVEQMTVTTLALSADRKHLHMRGADLHMARQTRTGTETSPHAWSRRMYRGRSRLTRRNISTCVEQTLPPECSKGPREKHLHMRGADLVSPFNLLASIETSPHAWSRFITTHHPVACIRNISTCVEQIKTRSNKFILSWKHLHMRGADTFLLTLKAAVAETSPHAWSRWRMWNGRTRNDGNISTCVEQIDSRIDFSSCH